MFGFFVGIFFYKETIAVRDFFFLIRHESWQWPPFQLTGSRGSSRLLKCRKALVTALGFSPVCHKMSPDTKPSHSYQCTPTALPTNVTSFFPPTAKVKKKKKNLTHPYLANWNKINENNVLCNSARPRKEVGFFSLSANSSSRVSM